MNFLKCVLVLVCLPMFGCATGTHKDDPYESLNRSMYSFNKGLDDYLLRPVAKGYDTVTPTFVQDRVGNFVNNIDEVPTLTNSILQGKLKSSFVTLGRIIINTSIGIGGLFDPATPMGLDKRDEDFGQTLGVWGVEKGPYLMLPLVGPSSLRDVWSHPVDGLYSVSNQIDHVPTRNSLLGLKIIDKRAKLLPYDQILAEALDEYAFVRDAYLQRREYLIYDGNPPLPEMDEDCDPADDDCY